MRETIVRWDPFRDLVRVQDELNQLFGRTFGEVGPTRPSAGGAWMPPMDVYETEDKVIAKLELPGIEPGDVDVTVEDSMLMITGKREFTSEVNEENYHRLERRYGAFSRSIALPQSVDTSKVDASFDKGLLTIEVAKVEKAKPKKIAIKAKA